MKKHFINWMTSKEPVSVTQFVVYWLVIIALLMSPLYLPRF